MKWIVQDVPTWVVAVVLIVGLPLASVALKYLIVRYLPSLRESSHNDVAGFQVAIVAVVYAIIVGFTIVTLYDNATTANQEVSTEAADLLQVHIGDSVLGHSVANRVDYDVVDYAKAVVANWTTLSEGTESARVTGDLNNIYSTLDRYTPKTQAEKDYLASTIGDLDQLSQAGAARSLEARESGSLPFVLWLAILITSAITLGFALLFSLENKRVAYIMVIGVSMVLAVNLFVLVELGYPFTGSVSVGPGKFVDVVQLVGAHAVNAHLLGAR
jgi:hypothetical protein